MVRSKLNINEDKRNQKLQRQLDEALERNEEILHEEEEQDMKQRDMERKVKDVEEKYRVVEIKLDETTCQTVTSRERRTTYSPGL